MSEFAQGDEADDSMATEAFETRRRASACSKVAVFL